MNIRYDRIIAICILLIMFITVSIFAFGSITNNTPNETFITSIEESNISFPENEIFIENTSTPEQEVSQSPIVNEEISIPDEESQEKTDEPIRGPMGGVDPKPLPLPQSNDKFIYYTSYKHPNQTKYPNPILISRMTYEQQLLAYNLCEKYDVPFELMMGIWEKETCFNINIGRVFGDSNDPAWYCGIGMVSEKHCLTYLQEQYNIDLHTPMGGMEGSIVIMKEKLIAYDNDWHKAATAYNRGNGGAEKLFQQGIYTSSYSNHVVFVASNLISENDIG